MNTLHNNNNINSFGNLIDKLIDVAKLSLIGQQLAATLLNGTTPVGEARENDPRSKCRKLLIGSFHAEMHTMKTFFGPQVYYDRKNGWQKSKDLQRKSIKLNLFVIRVDKENRLCNARPCINCLRMMKEIGIRKVYYSIAPDKIVCENVRDMVSVQVSSTYKFMEKIKGNYDNKNPHLFYINVMQNTFPREIKKYNLDCFIQYNLINVLPDASYMISNKNTMITIYNKGMQIVTASIL